MLEELLNQQFLYNGNSRYVVLLRDPVERALSHFCMFAMGVREVKRAIQTADICHQHPQRR